jgi:hypothetical protein
MQFVVQVLIHFFIKAHKIIWVAHKLTWSVGNRNQAKKMLGLIGFASFPSALVVQDMLPTSFQSKMLPLVDLYKFK